MGSAEPGPADGAALAAAKVAFRAQVQASRSRRPAAQRAAAATALRDAVLSLPQVEMAGTIAGYYSMASEPDTHGLLYALWKRGSYVLLPQLLPDNDLDWASYEGPHSMQLGARGLLEPVEPSRGVDAVGRADVILVPALAVDRRGYRLGRGGGSYDRALARVGPNAATMALLYDGELVEEVPAGPHDQRVRLAALPSLGIVSLSAA